MLFQRNAFKEMETLQKSLNYLFRDFEVSRQFPRLNVFDDQENVYVECLLPGIDPEKMDLAIERNLLTIKGAKTASPVEASADSYLSERTTGNFTRTIELYTEIDPEQVKAEYKHGVLLITLGKAKRARSHKIQITAGE